jgi:hypothetical protein
MRFMLISMTVAALILTACAAQATSTPDAPSSGTPKLDVKVTCTDQNTVMFEIKNTGDPIPLSGWVYRITDKDGKMIEQGALGLATDETESMEMEGAGPYTLIIINANMSQKGEC